MRLKTIEFKECPGSSQEWTLERLTLGRKNLIVGKNASGKSRTLNVISGLALTVAGLRAPGRFARYDCTFEEGATVYRYFFETNADQDVLAERLEVDGKVLLERGPGGFGTIHAVEIGATMKFQTPVKEAAVAARRDTVQHPFLEPLYTWGSSLRHHQFGTNLGKDSFAVFQPGAPMVNDRDQQAVVGVFRNATREFDSSFQQALKDDMAAVGYDIERTELGPQIAASLPNDVVGLRVKESGLPGITDQISMSQGMYRVLSLLIYVNYFQLKGIASCIVIDDIGEGLDFDRSCRLITLLRNKTDASNLQIIMSTNDRFVMNEVPLEEWSFLQRRGNHVVARNIGNSREVFENFKFTGLSNFSFLELDVLGESDREEASQHA